MVEQLDKASEQQDVYVALEMWDLEGYILWKEDLMTITITDNPHFKSAEEIAKDLFSVGVNEGVTFQVTNKESGKESRIYRK